MHNAHGSSPTGHPPRDPRPYPTRTHAHMHCTGRTTGSRLRADHTTHNHEQAHSIPPTEHTIEGGEAHTQSSTQRLDAACNRHTHKHTRPTAHDTNTPHDHEGRVYPHWEASHGPTPTHGRKHTGTSSRTGTLHRDDPSPAQARTSHVSCCMQCTRPRHRYRCKRIFTESNAPQHTLTEASRLRCTQTCWWGACARSRQTSAHTPLSASEG